jgi:hypothetical protein
VGRATVRAAIGNYLGLGATGGAIPSLSTVHAHPPKLTKETDFYTLAPPGEESGTVILLYLQPSSEQRIALGGYTNGRKARLHEMSLVCFFRYKGVSAEDCEAGNDAFLDGLVDWIRASRNAGTQAVSLGGNGTGTIFSWGEGPYAGVASGGTDITIRSSMAKTIRGQVSQVFSVVDLHVIEIVAS